MVGMLEGMLAVRLSFEFDYYKMVNNIDLFMSVWDIQRLLCLVTVREDLVFFN